MTLDKWNNLVDMVEVNFGIDEKYTEKIADDIPGSKQIIEFKGPLGKIKLEFTEKARLEDVKTIYSDRVGSSVKVNKTYSEDEKVCFMEAYKWDEIGSEWQRIDESVFGI